jgi:hypothetical protein
VKVTIRWDEPDFANGVIDLYDLRINCSKNTNSSSNNSSISSHSNVKNNSSKDCQESVRLKAREREFIFKEDVRDKEVRNATAYRIVLQLNA